MITDTVILADYAILYVGTQQQRIFKILLQTARNANVPAVPAKFVNDCLSKGTLLDPTNYLYELKLKQKRKRPPSITYVESESEDGAPEIDEAEPNGQVKNARLGEVERMRIKMTKEQEAKSTPRRATSAEASGSYPRATNGSRTPTTPPESTRETCPVRYKFSRAEDNFALRFAKVMVNRDCKISQTAVVNAIHKKVSVCRIHKNHSLKLL
jgi:hypothetical protein